MYLVIAENLQKAGEKSNTIATKKTTPIQANQVVTLKVHVRKTLEPKYEGTYRVLQIKGNQVKLLAMALLHQQNGHMFPI